MKCDFPQTLILFPGDLLLGCTELASCQPCLLHPRQKVLLKNKTISSLFMGGKASQLSMCFMNFGFHQRRWEVDPAEGGDNGSWGHPLHWRRLWVRHLLPHQISCGPTKGFTIFLAFYKYKDENKYFPQRIDIIQIHLIITGLLQNNWKWISAFQPKPLQLWEGKAGVFKNNKKPNLTRFASLCWAPGRGLKARLGTLRPRPSFKWVHNPLYSSLALNSSLILPLMMSSSHKVLISIQSLILCPEPYYNEPGFERSYGTTQGGFFFNAKSSELVK